MVRVDFQPDGGRTAGFLYIFFDISMSFWH